MDVVINALKLRQENMAALLREEKSRTFQNISQREPIRRGIADLSHLATIEFNLLEDAE